MRRVGKERAILAGEARWRPDFTPWYHLGEEVN